MPPFFRPQLAFSRPAPGEAATADNGGAPGLTPEESRRFRELVLPHLDAAYNFARYLTRDPTAAEDLVQDAFLKAFRAFPGFRGGQPKAWLLTIVRNRFLDLALAKRTAARVLVDEGSLSEGQARGLGDIADAAQPTPEAALLADHEAAGVRAVIEALPEPFRETLVLREMEELSYKEIAALTGAPVGTVMSRLKRGRQMLSELLLPGRAAGAEGADPQDQEARR